VRRVESWDRNAASCSESRLILRRALVIHTWSRRANPSDTGRLMSAPMRVKAGDLSLAYPYDRYCLTP
jgi:hypothetical protein